MSDYPKIALKHSGRYSIYAADLSRDFYMHLNRDSLKKSGQIFTVIYLISDSFDFFRLEYAQFSIPRITCRTWNEDRVDLFRKPCSSPRQYTGTYGPTSFFENRNPYSVISVGVFFWSLASLRHSRILSSLGIGAALCSIVISGSRNGVLTLVICLLILLYSHTSNKSAKHVQLLF